VPTAKRSELRYGLIGQLEDRHANLSCCTRGTLGRDVLPECCSRATLRHLQLMCPRATLARADLKWAAQPPSPSPDCSFAVSATVMQGRGEFLAATRPGDTTLKSRAIHSQLVLQYQPNLFGAKSQLQAVRARLQLIRSDGYGVGAQAKQTSHLGLDHLRLAIKPCLDRTHFANFYAIGAVYGQAREGGSLLLR
jgi:hypothetical protein